MWRVFFKGLSKVFTGKVSFEQRPERSEGASHVNEYLMAAVKEEQSK